MVNIHNFRAWSDLYLPCYWPFEFHSKSWLYRWSICPTIALSNARWNVAGFLILSYLSSRFFFLWSEMVPESINTKKEIIQFVNPNFAFSPFKFTDKISQFLANLTCQAFYKVRKNSLIYHIWQSPNVSNIKCFAFVFDFVIVFCIKHIQGSLGAFTVSMLN